MKGIDSLIDLVVREVNPETLRTSLLWSHAGVIGLVADRVLMGVRSSIFGSTEGDASVRRRGTNPLR